MMFGKTKRSEKAIENENLMRPEVRALVDLPFKKKVEESQKIIREAYLKFDNIGLGFSGGTDSLVLLHIATSKSEWNWSLCPKLKVVFINTYHQFPETRAFVYKTRKEWNLDMYEAKAEEDRFEEFREKYGFNTPEFITTCCEYHKIQPKNNAIRELGLDAFLSGIRGVEHEERAKEKIFSERDDHMRVHPLLFWRRNDVLKYVKTMKIECNPVYKQGYTSLGCEPCTSKNPEHKHERAGRGSVRESVMKFMRGLGYD